MKMRHIIIFILTIILIAIGLLLVLKKDEWIFKNKDKKDDIEPIEKFSYTPIMYKICDENNCNYLVGAMHLGDAHIKDISSKVIDAYKEMDAVALEIDTTDYTFNFDNYLLPKGVTVDTLMSEELSQKMEEFSSKHPLFLYDQYKSYKLGVFTDLLVSIMYMELGYMTEGVDSYFQKRAHEENKEVISIETIESQEAFLNDYSDELYKYIIENTIDKYDDEKELCKKLYAAYLEGNASEIKNILTEEEDLEISGKLKEEIEKYYQDLYTNRNVLMAAAIEEYLKEDKNVFVTVGAAHIVLDEGIIDILTNKGYKITQMN